MTRGDHAGATAAPACDAGITGTGNTNGGNTNGGITNGAGPRVVSPSIGNPNPDISGSGSGIAARDVTVTYRNGLTALRHASFTIPRGTVTALLGVNGAGKSTLFKAIMGFVRVASGDIRLLDLPVATALKRNLVAYVPQAEEVDWSFPVLVQDVVMMGRYGHMGFLRIPSPADHAAVDAALARVGMTELRHRQIGALSGGQRKRVFLARALAQNGQVILLDEPFTGVDLQTEDRIIALLGELRAEGRVMLVSTHNLAAVPDFCDRVILVKGSVLAHGPTETTFTRDNLQAAFGGALRPFTPAALHGDPCDWPLPAQSAPARHPQAAVRDIEARHPEDRG